MTREQAHKAAARTGGLARSCLLAVLFLLLSAASRPGWAATFTARLDRDSVSVGETANLQLVFEDGEPQSLPAFPNLPNLEVGQPGSSRQFQMVNGQTSRQLIINYPLTPRAEGTFTIPALVAIVGGQRLVSQPVQLRVGKVDASAVSQQAFLKFNLPRTNLYVGETVLFELDLYAIAQQEGAPEIKSDGITLGKLLGLPGQIVNLGRQRFARYNFRSYLTAVKPGPVVLGPAQFNVRLPAPNARRTIFGDIADWRQLSITADAISLYAQPLPTTNVPPHFTGSVGSYSMSVSATPTNVAVGDPVTVKIEIAGNSLLDTIRLPEQTGWDQFKVYPPTGKLEGADQLGLGGRKFFEQVVVPQSTELRELPPFVFSFFDPVAKTYRTLTGPVIPLIVRPSASAQPVAMTDETNTVDLVHIKPQMGGLVATQTPLILRPWFLLFQGVPVLVWAALSLRRRHLDHLASNPRLRRRIAAAKAIEAGLAKLPALADAGNGEEFFAAIFRLLQERLGERLDLPATAITESVIDEYLRPGGMDETLLGEIGELFQACNQARYAPRTSARELNQVIAKTKDVLARLEKIEITRAAKVGVVACLSLLLGLQSASAAASAGDFEAANRLYEQGRYSAAIAAYSKLIENGQISAALYFNLGNAFFKGGQTGRAVITFRQAQRLAPRDPDIRANLQFVRRAVTGKEDIAPRRWTGMVGRLSLNEWACLTAVAMWAWFGLLALGQWRPAWRRSLRAYTVLCVALVGLFGVCLGAMAYERFGTQTAAVTVRDAQARLGPYEESKAAFPAPDGLEVDVISTKDDWFEVRDFSQRTGWVKKDQVTLIR